MNNVLSLRGDLIGEKEVPDLLSVPALLRNIADRIEEGEYGIAEMKALGVEEVLCRGALVLRISGQEPTVFGLGATDPTQSFMDFHAGAQQLMSMQRLECS